MALKDIFSMVKADRYTQDGCEILNKAREADVEDRTYKIGEISQKTGLQKTTNGWVKPKGGKAPAKKEAMKKALKKQASMMAPAPFSSTESKPAESKPATTKAPKPTMQQYMKAKQDIKQFEDTFKKQNEQYEARQRMGEGATALSPLWGRKPNDYKNDPQYKKAAELVKAFEAEDSAPRVLTGDTRIRVRKA